MSAWEGAVLSIYVDTNAFISAYEAADARSDDLLALFAAIADREFKATTSEIRLAELLPKPLSLGQKPLIDFYTDLLSERGPLDVVPVSRAILLDAAILRGRNLSLKLADSVHVATALRQDCAAFLSDDRRLPSFPRLRNIRLGARSLREIRQLGA